MERLPFLATVLAMAVDHLVQTRGGALGMVALFLLGAGIRAKNTPCTYVGAITLVLLMIQA